MKIRKLGEKKEKTKPRRTDSMNKYPIMNPKESISPHSRSRSRTKDANSMSSSYPTQTTTHIILLDLRKRKRRNMIFETIKRQKIRTKRGKDQNKKDKEIVK